MSLISNLSLGRRLALAFGFVCAAIVLLIAVTSNATSNIGAQLDKNQRYAEMSSRANDLSRTAEQTLGLATTHLYVFDGDLANEDKIAKQLTDTHEEGNTLLKGIGTRLIDAADKRNYVALEATRNTYFTALFKAVARSRYETTHNLDNRDGSRNAFLKSVLPLGQAYGNAAEAFANDVDSDAARASSKTEALSHAESQTTLIVGVFVVLFAIAIAILLTRSVTRPVKVILNRLTSLSEHCATDLENGLGALAEGDLTQRLEATTPPTDITTKDELGRIAAVDGVRAKMGGSIEAYNRTGETLTKLVGEVRLNATTVSAASQQMASTSEETGRAVGEIASAVGEVASGAERQVRQVEMVRASAAEAATAARTSATRASEASEVAARARATTEEGITAAEDASRAMQAVAASSEDITASINDLAAKSQQIGTIVETITGIASQTNLLALNAAIEAARAGEQGRGFAVVAEEVRKLAEGSQTAAEEIAGLVEEVQERTEYVVTIVTDGTARSTEGTETVETARAAFQRIGEAVDEVTARIEEIAGAAHQITVETEKVNNDVTEVAAVAEQSSASTEQVSASTQETSASSQEIAASAQQLAETATELNRLMAAFTLESS